ncbi:MAG: c-type cytochrome [Burkholderiaceae bacterium]
MPHPTAPKTLVPAMRLAALAAALLLAASGVRAQDAATGAMSFLQCADCHSPGANNGVGPGLKGVVGRKAGTQPDFAYSAAMSRSALTWDDKTLDAFLADPRTALPGTSMAFPGVEDAKDRADLIAYLKTLK